LPDILFKLIHPRYELFQTILAAAHRWATTGTLPNTLFFSIWMTATTPDVLSVTSYAPPELLTPVAEA
jgi:hypothetical protein